MPTLRDFGILCLCAALAAQGPAPSDREQRFERLRAELEQQRIEHHVQGMALAIVFADGPTLTADFGLADAEQARRVGPDTVFSIGSATKSFTAVLTAMVAADGKLGLDDRVDQHLPWFRLHDKAAAEVTLRDLLCHRSGLGRTDALLGGPDVTEEELARQLAQAEPVGGFREHFGYNNQLYLVAGMVTAAAAGKDWHSLLRDRLLAPLGMKGTTTRLADTDRKHLASGYAWSSKAGSWQRLPTHGIDLCAPCGAIYSTAGDMARWLRFLLQRGKVGEQALLPAGSLASLWRTEIAMTPGADEGYGLGFMLRPRRGQQLVHHGGNLDGFSTQVMLLPEAGMGFVLLMNAQFAPLQTACQETVLSAMLDPVAPTAVADDLQQFPGIYRFELGQQDWRVLVGKNGKLAVDVPGQQIYELRPPDEAGKRYFALTDAIAVRFEVEDKAEFAASLTLFQAGKEFRMPRTGPLGAATAAPAVTAPATLSAAELAALQRFTGRYRLPKPQPGVVREMTALVANGKLALDVPGQRVYELKPPNAAGRWVFALTHAIEVAFDTNAAGDAEALTMFQGGMEFRYQRVEAAPSLPTAVELAALMAKAMPKESGLGDQVVRARGRVAMPNQGLTGTFWLVGVGSRRLAVELDFGKFGTARMVVDGERGWRYSQRTGSVDLSPEEVAAQRREMTLFEGADAAKRYASLEAVRSERDGDRSVVVVRRIEAGGESTTLHLDAETGDILRRDGVIPLGEAGSLPTTMTFRDFRLIAGARIAHRVRSTDAATGRTEFEIESIEIGGEVAAGVFEAPGKPAAK